MPVSDESRGYWSVVTAARFSAAAQTREQALRPRARAVSRGHHRIAITDSGGDTSPQTAFDLAVILVWAKCPREATDLFERTPPRSARVRAPGDDSRILGPTAPPGGVASGTPGSGDDFRTTRWAKLSGLIGGEAAERSGDLFTALEQYEDARRKLPDDPELAAASAGVLARLGAPHAAASALSKADPGLEAQKAGLWCGGAGSPAARSGPPV